MEIKDVLKLKDVFEYKNLQWVEDILKEYQDGESIPALINKYPWISPWLIIRICESWDRSWDAK